MEEPAIYTVTPLLTCSVCGREVPQDPAEAEASAELERSFPSLGKPTFICEECADRVVQ